MMHRSVPILWLATVATLFLVKSGGNEVSAFTTNLQRSATSHKSSLNAISSWSPDEISAWASSVQFKAATAQAPGSLDQAFAEVVKAWEAVEKSDETLFSVLFQTLAQQLAAIDPGLLILTPLVSVAAYTLVQLAYPPDDFRSGKDPYLRGFYDPDAARAFYKKQPKVVLQRSLQLFRLSNKFIFQLWLDKNVFRNEDKVRAQRADDLLQLITKLGPTAIKVGQALSVRSDIIPAEYAEALATLQDQVPPFPTTDAITIIKKEWGADLYKSQISSQSLSPSVEPVASASIGQVYKVTLKGKSRREVAIKIQRPNILAEIALDLYIVRELVAPFYQKYITKSTTDFQALANEWGRGFIAELDYSKEARSTIRFNEEMKVRGLDASVMAPNVVSELSTQQVLVTEWIDGKRIDQSEPAADIPRLCSVALNAYLVMLLELKSLHCDPHPGNLLKTKDGKLCILDFGMTLDVDSNLQYSLLEYIAHCTSDNYEKVPEDLVNMGFLKPEKLEFAQRSGALDPLIYFLREAGRGGGAKGTRERILADFRQRYPGMDDDELRKAARDDMKTQMKKAAAAESIASGITMEVEDLQRKNRDSFVIPEWFVYTSRAFGTLEGVSLQADEDYSLINSCFPYIAKRLVKDDSPRARKALRDLLYGAGDKIDPDRLTNLASGFSSYTTTTKRLNKAPQTAEKIMQISPSQETPVKKDVHKKVVETEATITLAKDVADVLLAPNGTLIQTILVEEGVLAASASIKDQFRSSLVDRPKKIRDTLPLGIGSILPPLPTESISPFVQKSDAETKAQDLFAKILRQPLKSEAKSGDKSRRDAPADLEKLRSAIQELEPEQLAILSKELRQLVPKYGPLLSQFENRFRSHLLRRASGNIDTTLESLKEQGQEPDAIVKWVAQALSRTYAQAADSGKPKA